MSQTLGLPVEAGSANSGERILVIEDDHAVQKALKRLFEAEGFSVDIASSGTAGMELFRTAQPTALVLDLRLPGMSGQDVCREIKQAAPSLPVVILSAKSDVMDKVLLLEMGADDYVTKPFSIRELLARVKAVLRRTQTLPRDQERYAFGDVEVNLRSYQVTRGGNRIEFSNKEFELLKHFLSHSGETLSRDRLLDEVWGYENFPTTRTVDAHIVRLRQKLEPIPEEPRYFLTVHGVGYKFVG